MKKHRPQWICFNVCALLVSIGLAIGTFMIAYNEQTVCSVADLKTTLWLIFAMHIVNSIECLLNITTCEKYLCSGMLLCIFFIFEVTILVYMQVEYFKGMQCINETKLMYFWLMGQILIFYVVVVFILCFFFRKFCQDDKF